MENMCLSLLVVLWLGIPSVLSSDTLRRQKRHWIVDTFQIVEEYQGPFPYVLGKIHTEEKFQVGFNLKGQGVDLDPKGVLSIDIQSGVVSVVKKVDYEMYKKLRLTFEARNRLTDQVSTRLGVEVEVLDINDNAPVFQFPLYEVNIPESVLQGSVLVSVMASDKDTSKTPNGTFNFKIVSVTPKPTDLEFFIEQRDHTGIMKFKGCLNHEKAEKYTILVEAKDHGEQVQLSSTCTVTVHIEDGNNHLPVFTGQTGPGSVKEREGNVSVLRLQVSDEDTRGTAAWKARYTLHGDKANNFRITTDPKTNEGVLHVEKPLDYEEGPLRNLSVSVENEAPFYSCRVEGRQPTGLWAVVSTGDAADTGLSPPMLSICQVSVRVEDVNDPPIFVPAVKHARVEENLAVGHHLETLTATDTDVSHANNIAYMKGVDPGDWVMVDSKTGKITTVKILDRESQHVINNVYNVTLYAVDDGKPPTTGTGTLIIHLTDQDDNIPTMVQTELDMCLSDGPSVTNITAFDLDADPYSGPFNFQLQGDVKGKWMMEPNHGYSVHLVKEANVHAGHHDLQLAVFDLQGQPTVHNLTITVCKCADPNAVPNCGLRRAAGSRMGVSAIAALFFCMLLMLGVLLLALLLSCKTKKIFIATEESEKKLIPSYTESIGTDCKVPLRSLYPPGRFVAQTPAQPQPRTLKYQSIKKRTDTVKVHPVPSSLIHHQQHQQTTLGFESRESQNRFSKRSITYGRQGKDRYLGWSEGAFTLESDTSSFRSEVLFNVIHQMMSNIQAKGVELGDYAPHPYAEEGDDDTTYQLDAIPMPEEPFDTDMLLHLGPRFDVLALICRP